MTISQRTKPVYVAPRLPTFHKGQRVHVTRGGHSGEFGTVRDVRATWDGSTFYSVTLDTLTLYIDDGARLEAVTP